MTASAAPAPSFVPPPGSAGSSSEAHNARVFPRVGPELFAALRQGHYRKVVLQVPAGLVRNAHELAERIHSESQLPVVLGARACFGACDGPSLPEASGADVSVVLGHAPIPNAPPVVPTFFVEMRDERGDAGALVETIDRGGLPKRLGLVASVQHLDLVPSLRAALERRDYTVRTAAGDHRLAYEAQALGCNYTTAESIAGTVDAFVFLGTGRFHPVGLAFAVDRPVWALDPLQNQLAPPIDRSGLVARRLLMVARARDARRWGVLVSSFGGQRREGTARALQARAREQGRDAEILIADRIDPRDLEGRDLEAYVSTACPRIALDDAELYPRPLLTPPEFLMALGVLPLEPYRFDTFH